MQYPEYFHNKGILAWLLLPLSWVYCLLISIRIGLYRWRLLPRCKIPVPVIIVGNVTVGGTGKTPVVIMLVDMLRQMGYHPGIVSRGYGRTETDIRQIEVSSTTDQVGDEPLMIFQRTSCPFVVGASRCEAVKHLLESNPKVDVVIGDDGLQHYALQRDIELAVVDSKRIAGNGFCLPAGPLREPLSRLKKIDFILYNGGGGAGNHFQVEVSAVTALLESNTNLMTLHQLRGETVHAVAGIGNPERFFSLLENAGLVVNRHEFPDHHQFLATDICFDDSLPVLMTEKDAVKCRAFATNQHWYLEVDAILPEHVFLALRQILKRKLNG